MLLEPLIPVSIVVLSIMGTMGYVRVNNFAKKSEFDFSTWQKMDILVEIFLS